MMDNERDDRIVAALERIAAALEKFVNEGITIYQHIGEDDKN